MATIDVHPPAVIPPAEDPPFFFGFTADDPAATFQCSLDNEPFAACENPYEFAGADLAVGPHNFRVRATDLAGNTGAPARYDFAISDDQTPPETTLLTKPPAQTNEDWATFTFESNDPTATFECNLDGQGFEECFNPGQFVELEPGNHTFEVRAVDLSLNPDLTPASYAWVYELDNEAPETTIHTYPPNPSLTVTAIFTFGAVGPEIEYECQLDNEAWESCEPPMLYEELTGGEHTFRVRATDFYGNVEQTPATYTWVQAVNPEVTLLTTPEDPSEVNAQTFTFSSNQSPVTFECRLTGAMFTNWTACSSPHTYTNLLDGEYLFEVRSKNQYGLASEIPGEFGWEVAVPPETTIHHKPTNPDTATSAAFTFSSSEPTGALWECELDNQSVDCLSSPVVFAGLANGTHTFSVAAIDAMDNVDPTPATYTWVIDTLPETSLGNTPPASTPSTSASFTFSSNESNVSYECSLDNAAFAPCSAPVNLSGLSIASHTFRVQAKDSPRNQLDPTPASYTWSVVDGTAPNTAITSVQTGSISFSFNGSDNHSQSGALTFQCRLDNAAFADCTSPKTYADPGAGSHTFEVRAVDQAGNIDASPATHTWNIADTVAPNTSISHQPTNPSTTSSASFQFTGTDNLSSTANLTYECRIDSSAPGDFAACTNPKQYFSLAGGSHKFDVRAVDQAGNRDATPASYTWTIQLADTTPPDTVIDQKPQATTTDTNASFTFSSTETGSTFQCKLDTGAWGACTAPKTYTGLTVTQHTFSVRATDAAQNQDPSEASYTWTVQSPAPPANCGSQVVLTANADAWIDQGSTSANKGGDSILKVMSKSGGNLRALVRFMMPTMPAGCQVESATLRLYAGSYKDGRTLEALRLDDPWSEGGVTWGNAPPTVGNAVTVNSGAGYRDWNVAGQAQAMYAANDFNGWLIRDANENQDAEQQLHSREKGSDLPQLVLKFGPTSAPPPPPPTDTTPPDTSITSAPSNSTTSTTAEFRFSSTETGSTFQCRLNSDLESSFCRAARPRRPTPASPPAPTASRCARRTRRATPTRRRRSTPGRSRPRPGHDGAADDDRRRPDRHDDGHQRDLQVLGQREPGDLPVQARHGLSWRAAPRRIALTGLGLGNHTFEVRATDAATTTISPRPRGRGRCRRRRP